MRYFDLHCDTARKCFDRNCGLYDNSLHVSLKRASKFERWAQVFAVWIDDSFRGEDAWRRFEKASGFFLRQLSETAGAPALCTRRADLEKAAASSRNAAILSIEGAAALGGKPEHLYGAYRQGVRLVTLTWNGRCETGDGCMVPDAGGLTPFGLDVVREMERLGMVVDVSHLSEKGFRDVLRAARTPFVASHSDSTAVCAVPRTLADWQFRAAAGRGGPGGPPATRPSVWSLGERTGPPSAPISTGAIPSTGSAASRTWTTFTMPWFPALESLLQIRSSMKMRTVSFFPLYPESAQPRSCGCESCRLGPPIEGRP